MDKELLEQFQLIMQAMEKMATKDDLKNLRDEVKQSEMRTQIFIENQVTKRIDNLFDGYKLAHDKQWELEHKTEALQKQIEDIQVRLMALENKTA